MAYTGRLFFLIIYLSGCTDTTSVDKKMNEMCSANGGVRVHELIRLPRDQFDENGLIKVVAGGDKYRGAFVVAGRYLLRSETKALIDGDPSKRQINLMMIAEKITRIEDGKLISESTGYYRSGGDIFIVGHWSAASCPFKVDILKETFVME